MPIRSGLRGVGRRLRRDPHSAAAIVLVISLGIAVTVAMFSVVNGVVLRALPYPNSERIVTIHSENPGQGQVVSQLTAAEATEALTRLPGFDEAAYYGWGAFTFTGGELPRLIETTFVSASYFSVFGVTAALGRTLNTGDVAEHRDVVVLNHAAWVQLTGGDTDAVGRTLAFQGAQFELVGVLPESFAHPRAAPLMYRPMPAVIVSSDNPGYLDSRLFSAVGRLSEGVLPSLANEGLRARQAALYQSHGIADWGGWRLAHRSLLDDVVGSSRTVLLSLFAVALFALLVACSVAVSLVSIRLDKREKELAVRRTLGATNERIAADLLFELLLLVGIAAVMGLLVAALALEVLGPFLDATLPRGGDIAIDVGGLGFAVFAVTGTALLTCAMPLRRALLGNAASTLRAGAQELPYARRNTAVPAIGLGLATAAIASALALSVSLVRLGAVEPGFRTADIVALQIFRPVPDVARFVERAFAEVLNVPGVSNVSAVRSPPLDRAARFAMRVAPARAVESSISVDVQRAAAGYHAFLGIPILRGRDISERDGSQAPKVVVINETLAERVFGATDPVGQQLTVFIEGEPVPFEVIGIAQDVRNVGLRVPTNPEATVSMAQLPQWPFSVTLLVESAVSPATLMPSLQEAISRVDSGQAIARTFTLADELASQTRQAGLFARMSSSFAALALLLGLIGVHAVVAAMVGRRRREIGLRLALGATPANAAELVLASVARITASGMTIGAMLAAPTLAYLQGELFGVDTMSLVTVSVGTAFTLIMTSFAASGLSVWRAARVPPMDALRLT